MINIKIGNKKYQVKEAKTEEERTKGLRGIKSLPENEGMLFYLNDKQVVFNMKDMLIPLDIIFINDDLEVIAVHKDCKPNSDDVSCEADNDEIIAYVLEVNPNSGIKVGDELDFEDEDLPVMKVLASDGSVLMDLWGGERIFRRPFTKQLINAVKKAESLKNDPERFEAQCKVIGRKIFKEIHAQDNREPEYVKSPE